MIEQESVDWQANLQTLQSWIESCMRGGKVSRNTIAVGIVVFHHMLQSCPVSRREVISKGGEIKGARSGLGNILETYGIPRGYLKEVTTRQMHQDGQRLFEVFDWGSGLLNLAEHDRKAVLLGLIEVMSGKAREWLTKQNIQLSVDRRHAPTTWVNTILEEAKQRSGGVVEQHLVGAKLKRRFEQLTIPNHPAHAGDLQTAREGDFNISEMVYHVTAAPSPSVIQKCAANVRAGKHPILIVPNEQENRARLLAQIGELERELTIISLESFVALNIIELALEEDKAPYDILNEIISIYNQRLSEVETDLSLKIDLN